MKHTLLTLAAFAASTCTFADEWQKPVYAGAYQPLTAGESVMIYNTESHLFLGEGNDYGTHATVSDQAELFSVKERLDDQNVWDGTNYTIEAYSQSTEAWLNVFITDGGHVYNDRREQDDYYFTFTALEGNTYKIQGSDLNPVWKSSGDYTGYMLGHYTGYTNTKDGVVTGTGVIYDFGGEDNNYEPGEFNTTWAFVKPEDYEAYTKLIEIYDEAMSLKELIEKAEKLGVKDMDAEKAVYANTSSTLEELEQAQETLEKKVLAQMEESVTPDNPQQIFHDTCDDIDNWNNDIEAETWNTQTWIADGWTGFEGTTLNIWGSNLFGNAEVEIEDVPNGIYVIQMAAYSEKMDGSVYANETYKTVTAGAAGQVYTITTNVTDNDLSFGFAQNEAGTNWIAIDNVDVKYYGKGTKAYKFWLQSLKDSSTAIDDIVFQKSIREEYEAVISKVDAAETDEEILAVIKEYDEVLNKIKVSSLAYMVLDDAISKAEEMTANEMCNNYYGEKLSDMAQEKTTVYENQELDADAIAAEAEELNALLEEAQQYIWNVESLNTELENAAGIYAEYEGTASAAAKQAYNDFVAANSDLKAKDLTASAVKDLISNLYKIEFNLSLEDREATDEEPVDYSARIFNNGFTGVDGWTNEGWNTFGNNTWYGFNNEDGASSGDGNYLNLWNGSAADCYQVVTGLPAGAYTLTFGAYADKEGLEVYANANSKAIPVGQDEAYNYMRLYSIDVIVGDEGTLKIGVRNTAEGEMWAMADEFRLAYKGTKSIIMNGISSIEAAPAKVAGTYSINGARVSDAASVKNGIIIKNGKKVLNK